MNRIRTSTSPTTIIVMTGCFPSTSLCSTEFLATVLMRCRRRARPQHVTQVGDAAWSQGNSTHVLPRLCAGSGSHEVITRSCDEFSPLSLLTGSELQATEWSIRVTMKSLIQRDFTLVDGRSGEPRMASNRPSGKFPSCVIKEAGWSAPGICPRSRNCPGRSPRFRDLDFPANCRVFVVVLLNRDIGT